MSSSSSLSSSSSSSSVVVVVGPKKPREAQEAPTGFPRKFQDGLRTFQKCTQTGERFRMHSWPHLGSGRMSLWSQSTNMHLCIYICRRICTYMHIIYIYIYIHLYICIYMQMYIYIYIFVCEQNKSICICMYIYKYYDIWRHVVFLDLRPIISISHNIVLK